MEHTPAGLIDILAVVMFGWFPHGIYSNMMLCNRKFREASTEMVKVGGIAIGSRLRLFGVVVVYLDFLLYIVFPTLTLICYFNTRVCFGNQDGIHGWLYLMLTILFYLTSIYVNYEENEEFFDKRKIRFLRNKARSARYGK